MPTKTIPAVRTPRKKKTVSKAFNASDGLYWFAEIANELGFNPSVDKGPEIPAVPSFAAELIDQHCPAIPTLHDMVQQLTGRPDVTNVLYEIKELEDFLASMDRAKADNATEKVTDAQVDDEAARSDGSGRDADPEGSGEFLPGGSEDSVEVGVVGEAA